ncbi:hypothetical protein WAI453_012466 [Rhynchosporium graminicola]
MPIDVSVVYDRQSESVCLATVMPDRKGKKRSEPAYEETGRDRRSESGRRESTSHREHSRRDAPRSEPPIPESLQETSPPTTYGATSSIYSTNGRPRRDSESRSARPHLVEDHERRYEPVSTRHGDSKRYYSSGGITKGPRPENSQASVDGHDGSKPASARRPSHSSKSPPPRDWASGTSSSPVHESIGRMTINETLEGNFALHSQPDISAREAYEDDNIMTNELALSRSKYDTQAGSFQDKGKGIACDFSRPSMDLPESSKILIRGTRGGADSEKLDKNYTKRKSDFKKFFRTGRVFSTLWTEPFDDTMQSENDQFNTIVTYQVKFGQKVYSKIRRFVVVRKDERSCTCLPVTTYGGKGYKKRGLKLDNHGLIYSSSRPPRSVPGITKEPLRIILSKGAEKLNDPSYLHYTRVYTVETNVKVRDVGQLDAESQKLLKRYYRAAQLEGFSDDDEIAPTGRLNIPGRSNGPASFGPAAPGGNSFTGRKQDPGNDGRGNYEGSSGRYNQQSAWDNRGVAGQSNPAQPFYSGHATSSSVSTAPSYEYADVSQSVWSQQDSQISPAGRRSSQHSYQQPDFRYNPNFSATGRFASTQSMAPGYPGITFADETWSEGQSAQSSFHPDSARFGSSDLNPSQGGSYQAAGNPRYSIAASADPYYDPHTNQGGAGQHDPHPATGGSSHRPNLDDGEIHLAHGGRSSE